MGLSSSEKVKGLAPLFYTEMWECFGRFAINALLVLYLKKVFHFEDSAAYFALAGFLALSYVTPIFGGWLADRTSTPERAVLIGGCIALLGYACLIFPYRPAVFLGLAAVVVGNGYFLPSLAGLLGTLYENRPEERNAGFTLYYLGKNLGALLAPLLCGVIAEYYGYPLAFSLCAIGLASGLLVFHRSFGRKAFASTPLEVLSPKTRHTVQSIVLPLLSIPFFYAVIFFGKATAFTTVSCVFLCACLGSILWKAKREERRQIAAILGSCLCVVAFMSFLYQGGMSFSLFIERLIDRSLGSVIIPTPVYFALEPLFMMGIGWGLSRYWTYDAKRDRPLALPVKFAIAMLCMGLVFYIFRLAAISAGIHGHASMGYIVLAYFILPIAELFIMPISLAAITANAPSQHSTLMVSLWMVSNALAGVIAGRLAAGTGESSQNESAMSLVLSYQDLFSHISLVSCLIGLGLLACGAYIHCRFTNAIPKENNNANP